MLRTPAMCLWVLGWAQGVLVLMTVLSDALLFYFPRPERRGGGGVEPKVAEPRFKAGSNGLQSWSSGICTCRGLPGREASGNPSL